MIAHKLWVEKISVSYEGRWVWLEGVASCCKWEVRKCTLRCCRLSGCIYLPLGQVPCLGRGCDF